MIEREVDRFARYRMGRRIVAEEVGYRELQRRGRLSSELLLVYAPVAVLHDRNDRASLHYGTYSEYLATQEGDGKVLRRRGYAH